MICGGGKWNGVLKSDRWRFSPVLDLVRSTWLGASVPGVLEIVRSSASDEREGDLITYNIPTLNPLEGEMQRIFASLANANVVIDIDPASLHTPGNVSILLKRR